MFSDHSTFLLPTRISFETSLLQFCELRNHQSFFVVRLFATPWTAARQASLSFTISRSLLRLMSIESMMPSNHLILCHLLLLLPLSIGVFSVESGLHIRWPKYWSFSFSIGPSNEYSGLISFSPNTWGYLISSQNLVKVTFQVVQQEMDRSFGTWL